MCIVLLFNHLTEFIYNHLIEKNHQAEKDPASKPVL